MMRKIRTILIISLVLFGVLAAILENVRTLPAPSLSIIFGIVSILGIGIALLVYVNEPRRRKSAGFMPLWQRIALINRWHRGFVVDGRKKRLSEKVSFQSVLTVGGMGTGKSSTFVVPNLYTLDDCSFVVADTSGEIYESTSGYLAAKGFDIKVFNLMDTSASEHYNPLANLNGFTEVAQAANLIVRSSLPYERDPFWSHGAEKLIRIFIQCLENRGNSEEINLANVKYLINNFDSLHTKGKSRIDEFVLDSTIHDAATFNDYRGLLTGNSRTIESFLSTADTALSALGNPDIAQLTSSSTLDFSMLRKQKTALYVIARQQDLKFYSFLLNLFYTDLFNVLLSERSESHRPVYLLLDEFGHLTIPNFAIFSTTSRKYKIGFWIFLQSYSQLESRYGVKEAQTIREGLQTEIYLPGVGLETAQELERRLGTIKLPVKRSGTTTYVEEKLMDATEIIQLADNEALMLYSNKSPVILKTKPFYRQRAMMKASSLPPYPLPHTTGSDISYVDLKDHG